MIYLYNKDAGEYSVVIEGEEYRHLFKARRLKVSSEIYLRNLRDDYLYKYRVSTITKKQAIATLVEKSISIVAPKRELHIGWCIIDNKVFEKTLPSLNEIGVSKITPLICDRTQRNFKIDTSRVERILINSSQQCGRSKILEVMPIVSIDEFVKEYDSYMLNFSNSYLSDKKDDISNIVIGCEGGFTDREKALFSADKIVGLNTDTILRSESATISTASIILL